MASSTNKQQYTPLLEHALVTEEHIPSFEEDQNPASDGGSVYEMTEMSAHHNDDRPFLQHKQRLQNEYTPKWTIGWYTSFIIVVCYFGGTSKQCSGFSRH
jgi:hypothetical protein